MIEIKKFKNIFEGSYNAYGQTRKTEEYDERGKHKTKSVIIKQSVTDQMWADHLLGTDPALGIIPINEDSKCKWACIDIDVYNLNHKELIDKIKLNKLPLVVFRSKSGGAHVFLFTKEFTPAALFRNKLKDIAAMLGYARSEIFPKQNHINKDRGDVGSFLNLPYHNVNQTLRYAFKEDGSAMSINEFFNHYDQIVLTEEELVELKIKEDKPEDNDLLKGAPPCLKMLAKEGIPNGQRNNAIYNFGVYVKKRFPDNWDTKIFNYNDKYCQPPLDKKEIDILIKSITGKEYQYKCKDEPIASFCNSKKCIKQEFGVGDDFSPGLEIKEIQKYTSNPPIYYVTVGEGMVEVSGADLHEPDKFSLKCLEQINQSMLPVAKLIWRKQINKLLQESIPIEAPEVLKTDNQLKELLIEFISRANGKKKEDIKRGIPFTENGISYFKFKSFWNFLLRSKSWNIKYEATMRMLETLFGAKEEISNLEGKNTRHLIIKQLEVDKPIVRKDKIKDVPFN
jgi:hypothetical protein